jgi:hypothetical protein
MMVMYVDMVMDMVIPYKNTKGNIVRREPSIVNKLYHTWNYTSEVVMI